LELLLADALLADWSLALCDPLLSRGGGVLSEGRCQTDCASEAPPSLPLALLAAAALLLTSDAKTSFPCAGSGSDRADLDGAP
jgi:hypothetical protein